MALPGGAPASLWPGDILAVVLPGPGGEPLGPIGARPRRRRRCPCPRGCSNLIWPEEEECGRCCSLPGNYCQCMDCCVGRAPGDRGWRAPGGKLGKGLRASGFLIRPGAITNYREKLISLAGKLREGAVPIGGLLGPISERDVSEYVQVGSKGQEPVEQELARIDHPPEHKQADKRGCRVVAAARAIDPGKLKKTRGVLFEGSSANSAREIKTKKRIDVEKLATLVGATDDIYPLDYDTVVSVAAALEADGMRSVELIRLKQVPDGKTLDPWKVPLFPTVAGVVAGKFVMVAGWRKLASGREVEGHTPCRTGERRRAEEGWPILAFPHPGRLSGRRVRPARKRCEKCGRRPGRLVECQVCRKGVGPGCCLSREFPPLCKSCDQWEPEPECGSTRASSTVRTYVEEAYAEKIVGKAFAADEGGTPPPSLEDRVTKLEGLRRGQATCVATTKVPVVNVEPLWDDAWDSAQHEPTFVKSGNEVTVGCGWLEAACT